MREVLVRVRVDNPGALARLTAGMPANASVYDRVIRTLQIVCVENGGPVGIRVLDDKEAAIAFLTEFLKNLEEEVFYVEDFDPDVIARLLAWLEKKSPLQQNGSH